MYSKCKVFTPQVIVKKILDSVDYREDLYGKKILENSCGEGNILIEVCRRYISECIEKGMSKKKIKKGLEDDVHGFEIDVGHLKKCLINLDQLAKSFNIHGVEWNIKSFDFLLYQIDTKFDFIVGNPPYIKYQDIDEKNKKYLKEYYLSCRMGKFDYCYAFIEKSSNLLSSSGKMAYLIPNSIFKNVHGKPLRDLIKHKVKKIIDYTSLNLFEALTSSAILVLENDYYDDEYQYEDIKIGITNTLKKKNLGEKWIFSLSPFNVNGTRKFGDYFNVSYSVATLLNEAFVIEEDLLKSSEINMRSAKIESYVLRDAYSPRTLKSGKKMKIIFPYKYKHGILERYETKIFEKLFPKATKYLKQFESELSKRNSDKTSKWFEYGRSQALANINQEKILMSTVVTNSVSLYILNKDAVPYSGIFITRKSDMTLEEGKRILETESFFNYIEKIGINISGSSLRITSSDIKNFNF